MNTAGTLHNTLTLLLPALLLLCHQKVTSGAFAGINNSGRGFGDASSQKPAVTSSDRFKATCPADVGSIYEFDPNLVVGTTEPEKNNVDSNDTDVTWVAVFRSNNNLPSVLIKDEFLNAMRLATTVQQTTTMTTTIDSAPSTTSPLNDKIEASSNRGVSTTTTTTTGVKMPKPVAIAKLSPSPAFPNRWIIETMRCNLKKEDTDPTCDGQSEHAEALSICIDELILHHLSQGSSSSSSSSEQRRRRGFDGAIRTKATLVSGVLLEDRGFEEVTELGSDMATHVSCLDRSMERYAERIVTTSAKTSGSRDRALRILSCLGQLDRVEERERFREDEDGGEDEDSNPWASNPWGSTL